MASGSSSIRSAKRPIRPRPSFIDANDAVYDSTIPYDLRFFQSLDRFVQSEPWLTRDKAMIDQLKSIGIEKGKPFSPDEATERILNAAAAGSACLAGSEIRDHVRRPITRDDSGCFPYRPR